MAKAIVVRPNARTSNAPTMPGRRPKLGRIKFAMTLAPDTHETLMRLADERSVPVGFVVDELIREFESARVSA